MTARYPAKPTAEQAEMTAEPSAAFTAPNESAQPPAKPSAEQAESTTEQTAEPAQPSNGQTAEPSAEQTESTAESSAKASDWYADTLRAIVRRALDADKPDIKGALAALAMLAEVTEPAAKQEYDVAHILRDARRRAIHGKQQTE